MSGLSSKEQLEESEEVLDQNLQVQEQSVQGKQSEQKERKEVKTKKKVKKAGKIRYKTRCMKVGELKCLFLSCYNRGRSPLLSLGPSWPFTIFLLFFAAMIVVYFLIMVSMAKNANIYHLSFVYSLIIFNILVLFGGILKNPGVPQTYIDRILKEKSGKGEDAEAESEEEDIEASGNRPGRQNSSKNSPPKDIPKGSQWCRYCEVITPEDAYHCTDCCVCIEDYDHHCVFFSKCIGGGNLYCFWGSLGMVVVNFANIAILIATSAAFADTVVKPATQP